MEINLTREERRTLKKYLYDDLMTKCEYHSDLYPCKRDSLNTLMLKYFYWGDEYNDDYIPEKDYNKDNKLAMYLARKFEAFLEIPIEIRY